MAAFDPVASLPGAVNNTGDSRANFLKMFSGEVLTAFNRTTQFTTRTRTKMISSGKSAQFPTFGRADGAGQYLASGDSVIPSVIDSNEQVITIDGQLCQSILLAKQDEAYEVSSSRKVYSYQIGENLANIYDKNVAIMGILAARSTNPVDGLPGGSVIVNANAKTDAEALFKSLFEAKQKLEEKYVTGDAYAFVTPAQYFLLAQLDKVVNKDVNGMNGGFDTGYIKGIAGMEIVMTNNLPTTNITGTIGGKYDVDASNTAALVMTKDAVGTVKLMDLTVEDEYLIERQSTLMVASMMVGHGILKPECAVEIATA